MTDSCLASLENPGLMPNPEDSGNEGREGRNVRELWSGWVSIGRGMVPQ